MKGGRSRWNGELTTFACHSERSEESQEPLPFHFLEEDGAAFAWGIPRRKERSSE